MKLTKLQNRIYKYVKRKKYCRLSDIARHIYKEINQKPKSPNNSVLSAMLQVNKKYPHTFEWNGAGRLGATVFLNTNVKDAD